MVDEKFVDIFNVMKYKTYTDEQFIDAVKNSKSIAATLKLLNLVPAGGNYEFFNKNIKRLNVDTTHFTGQNHRLPGKKLTDEDMIKILTLTNFRLSESHKNYILSKKLLGEYICCECGISNIWNNKKITLHIDHINGNPHDHNISNLRLLCPNCHSQTDNYCALNKKKNNQSKGIFPIEYSSESNYKNNCIDCGNKCWHTSIRCKKCQGKKNGAVRGTPTPTS